MGSLASLCQGDSQAVRAYCFHTALTTFFRMFSFDFFRAQAVEEALRKGRDCPTEKETPKKGKGRGQASEKIRIPLHLTWKRVQARGAKVLTCGAQTKLEFQEISGKVERVRGNS